MTTAKSEKRLVVSFSVEEFEKVRERFEEERKELLEDLELERLSRPARVHAKLFLSHLEQVLRRLDEASKDYQSIKKSPLEAS